jgi:predicted DNA-binding transcriptional regulator YafY
MAQDRRGRGAATVSRDRAARLYKLLADLAAGPKPRGVLLRRLRAGLRTFYRDLDLLRNWGIEIRMQDGKYVLGTSLPQCLEALPFPDPELSFADAIVLAKGRTAAHRKLKQLVDALTR